MSAILRDLQQSDNPLNGAELESASELDGVFRSLADRKPFLFELQRNDGSILTVGFGGSYGCVQHSNVGGSPPYLMALGDQQDDDDKFLEFLAGNTPTPIPKRFCLPIKQVIEIIAEFMEHGAKSKNVSWEEI